MTAIERQPGVSEIALPLTIEQISAEWLTCALRVRYQNVAVTAANVVDVTAMTSTKIRLRLTYNDAGYQAGLPPTAIVKGGFSEHSAALAPMHRNEAWFYGEVATRVHVNAPTCYFAGTDPSTYQSVVILEDLVPKKVTFCNVRRALGYAQTQRFLDALARFHSQTWDSPEFAEGGNFHWVKERFEGGFGKAYFYDRYLKPEHWERMIAGARGAVIADSLHDHAWIHQAMGRIFDYHKRFKNCLIHGDAHVGNFYYEPDGTPGFLDMQPTRGPWQMDVTKFLIGALDIVSRREWERPLLAYYLERLRVYGVQPPSFEEAWEAHRREAAYGLIVFVVNENTYQTEDVNLGFLVRFATAVIDLGSKQLLS